MLGCHGRRVEAREEVVKGRLEDHLPDHTQDAPGHDILPEDPFKDREHGLGHPPEAVADLPLPGLRVT